MDALTHVFLPLTLVYVARRDLFESRRGAYLIAVFGLLPDFDKYVGAPGLLHSLVTLTPIILAIYLLEGELRGGNTYAPMIAFFVLSHLLLDFLGTSPVTLLYRFLKSGAGLEYSVRIVFGEGLLGARIEGFPKIILETPRSGFNAYPGLISGYGVAALLLFVAISASERWGTRRSQS